MLQEQLQEQNRYSDVACRFRVYERNSRKRLIATDQVSCVYGGRYDFWSGLRVGDTPDSSVVEYKCSAKQFELITCNASQIEGSGGRGSGKSEGGALRTLRFVAELPGEFGEVVGPTFRVVRIDWIKILALLGQTHPSWLLPGTAGIKRTERELHFSNGHVLRFVSADHPDSLRSWGGSYAWVDEGQDVTTEAIDIVWPSLRLTDQPRLWHTLTPKAGEPLERHQALLAEIADTAREGGVIDANLSVFDSYSNPFISHRVFDLARKRMDERRYRQEIGADWSAVVDEDTPYVLPAFKREKHGIHWPLNRGLDITREVTKRRTGYARDYIGGVDYNWDWPNFCVLMKVIAECDVEWGSSVDEVKRQRIVKAALADHRLQHWCAVAVVRSKGHAGHLGRAVKDGGYPASDVLVIDDASGQYNRGKNAKNSSSRLMRDEGFIVVHPTRNPGIKDGINALAAKLAPVDGEPTFHMALPECEELAESMENALWTKGEQLDKSQGFDHLVAATEYPVAYFCPAARIRTGVQGVSLR